MRRRIELQQAQNIAAVQVKPLVPACGDATWDALTTDAAADAQGWVLNPAPSVAAVHHLTVWLAEVDTSVAASQARVREHMEHVELSVDDALATCERSAPRLGVLQHMHGAVPAAHCPQHMLGAVPCMHAAASRDLAEIAQCEAWECKLPASGVTHAQPSLPPSSGLFSTREKSR